MKNLIKITILVLFLITNGFTKDIMFDLGAQDFQNSLIDQQHSTKYNIEDKVIAQTNLLKSTLGYYHTNAKVLGHFVINSIWPLNDWKFNLDIQYEGSKKKNRFIKFTDIKGEVILFEFHPEGFIFNSKDYKANLEGKHLVIQVVKTNEQVSLYLNKQLIKTQEVNFESLKSVETTVRKFSFQEQDKINGMMLVSHD